jgi:thioesterase domain-containing protein
MAISDDTILTESGMDSLSAVEFRNRLVAEYGVNLTNTFILDHPTVAAIATFLAEQVAGNAPAASAQAIVKLNERTTGVPLLLIPGALQTVDAFKPLASMVPVPVMGWDWPVTAQESLAVVATEAVRQLRDLRPTGPYRLGGHSIGGVLAAEMARQLEAAGETVEAVVLLDTRTLPPFVPLTPPEGVTIPSQLTWQLQCLADHPALATVAAPVLLFRAQDLSTVGPLEGFLGSAFQDDEEVARRLAKVAATVRTRTVAGRHFSLYAEPQVGELALQLCGQLAAL